MERLGADVLWMIQSRVLEIIHAAVGRDEDPILWWQMCLRAAIIFVWAALLYRVLPRKAFGSSATLDIVVVVIMGSTLSRALTGNAPLIASLVATAVLAALYYLVSTATQRSKRLSRLLKGRSVLLIEDGTLDRDAMRRCALGEGDVRENLRLQGIASLDQVRAAFVERNGQISVIKRNE